MDNYDLILDTSYETPEDIAETLYKSMKKYYADIEK